MSVEEVKSLVQKEREAEKTIEEARRKAAQIIEKAQKDAERLLTEAADSRQYDEYISSRTEEIKREEKHIEKTVMEKIEQMHKTGNQNLEQTTAFIVNLVLGVKS